jgi:Zn-dependent M28 family amino/carboxypeptidase
MAAAWLLAVFACAPAAVERPGPTSGVTGDVAILTSRDLDGRAVGTAGGDAAALFIAQRYLELGVPGAFPSACESISPCGSGLFQLFQIDGLGAKNVLAALPGTDPSLRGRFVVLGAHYDHLGRSPLRSFDPERKVQLRPGADDNASGTAALLELARRLVLKPAPSPVLFAHFDAEELGLLGSREFLDHPSVPTDSMALMINLDMVGRLGSGPLQVEVRSTTQRLESVMDSVAGALGLTIRYSIPFRARSDHRSFSERGIPAIWLFTGIHGDYHKTTDTPEKLDFAGINRVVDLAEALVRAAGNR